MMMADDTYSNDNDDVDNSDIKDDVRDGDGCCFVHQQLTEENQQLRKKLATAQALIAKQREMMSKMQRKLLGIEVPPSSPTSIIDHHSSCLTLPSASSSSQGLGKPPNRKISLSSQEQILVASILASTTTTKGFCHHPHNSSNNDNNNNTNPQEQQEEEESNFPKQISATTTTIDNHGGSRKRGIDRIRTMSTLSVPFSFSSIPSRGGDDSTSSSSSSSLVKKENGTHNQKEAKRKVASTIRSNDTTDDDDYDLLDESTLMSDLRTIELEDTKTNNGEDSSSHNHNMSSSQQGGGRRNSNNNMVRTKFRASANVEQRAPAKEFSLSTESKNEYNSTHKNLPPCCPRRKLTSSDTHSDDSTRTLLSNASLKLTTSLNSNPSSGYSPETDDANNDEEEEDEPNDDDSTRTLLSSTNGCMFVPGINQSSDHTHLPRLVSMAEEVDDGGGSNTRLEGRFSSFCHPSDESSPEQQTGRRSHHHHSHRSVITRRKIPLVSSAAADDGGSTTNERQFSSYRSETSSIQTNQSRPKIMTRRKTPLPSPRTHTYPFVRKNSMYSSSDNTSEWDSSVLPRDHDGDSKQGVGPARMDSIAYSIFEDASTSSSSSSADLRLGTPGIDQLLVSCAFIGPGGGLSPLPPVPPSSPSSSLSSQETGNSTLRLRKIKGMNILEQAVKGLPREDSILQYSDDDITVLPSPPQGLLGRSVEVSDCQVFDAKNKRGLYTGSLDPKTHVPDGYGTLRYRRGEKYTGDWEMGLWHGHGVLISQSGKSVYEGSFVKHQKHGKGVCRFADGRVFKGQFDSDEMKDGKMNYPDMSIHEGLFKNGRRNNFGVCRWLDGAYYEGQWKDDEMHGQGRFQWPDKSYYIGDMYRGMPQGIGSEFDSRGKLIHQGNFSNGQPTGMIPAIPIL